MKSEWSSRTFAELMDQRALEIGDGYRAKNEELQIGGDGLIFLRAGHVKDSHIEFAGVDRFKSTHVSKFGRKVAEAGDVVVTTKGNSTGRLAVVTSTMPRFVYSPHLSYWRSISDATVDQGFLRAWARSGEFSAQLAALSRSTDMAPYLSLSDQRRLRITLPPIETQREIAEFNDTISTRLELLRETNATLEAIAQALFKSWFVDFDPVRAKQQGIVPAGMDEPTAALFPARFEESEIGLVPEGWHITAVSDVADIVKGKSYSSSDLIADSRTALVTLKSFERGGGFRMDGFKGFVGNFKESQVVRAGDLIVAYTDVTQAAELIGKPAIVVSVDKYDTLVASLDVGIIRARGANIPKQFLYGLFQTALFQSHTLAHTSGTTVLHLAKDAIGSFKFPRPQVDCVRAFAEVADSIAARRQANSDLMRTLSDARDTLLPRLISGHLRIPEAEALLQ